MADNVIGGVGVSVTPDAEGFWRDFQAKTSGEAGNAGRRAGEEWRRGFDTAVRGNTVRVRAEADTSRARADVDRFRAEAQSNAVNLRVKADTAAARGQMSLLRDAILLLGPAAIPLGAVTAGAIAGLIPVAGAAALAISGISKDLKNGSLAGTQFATDLATVKTEFSTLQQTAARGLLGGLDTAIQSSQPLFATLNQDIGTLSTQLGTIVGGAAPALLNILTQLNPLFTTIGSEVARGAQAFEHWASSTTGITSFVSYVQAELPQVEHTIGQLVVLVSHLAQAFAPFGHLVLSSLGVLAETLNAIPIPVLTALTSGALAAYAAFRTFQGVTAIVTAVSGAVEGLQAKFAGVAATQAAAALAMQATEAASAAEFATAEAAKAAAAAEAAVEIAAAVEGTTSVLAAGAAEAAAAAIEFSAAMQAEADVAIASAAEVAASADAAAAAIGGAGAAASIGWVGVLGPLAAVGVGIALLTTLFSSDSSAAQENQKIMDGYAASLQKSSNALASVNVEQTAKNLTDQGAIRIMDQLNRGLSAGLRQAAGSTNGLRLSQSQLVLAVNGTQKQYDALYNSLIKVADANKQSDPSGHLADYNATGAAALSLAGKIKQLRGDMTAEMKVQADLAAIQKQSEIAINGGATAVAAHARALHLTSDAYLTAEQAAQKNTAQTQAQTAAFQLENDAASLLQNALNGLAGINLSTAQAQTAVASANLSVAQSFHTNGRAIDGVTAKAVANQQAIQQQVSAAQQYAQAIGKQTGSSRAAVRAFDASRKALEAQLRAHGRLTPAVQAYIDKLYNLSHLRVAPTKLDVKKEAAEAKLRELQNQINNIKQGHEPGLSVNSAEGQGRLAALQREINDLRQGRVPGVDVDTASAMAKLHSLLAAIPSGTFHYSVVADYYAHPGHTPPPTTHHAKGTTGPAGVPDGVFTVGERGYEIGVKHGANLQIISHPQAVAMTGMDRVPGYATGTKPTPFQSSNLQGYLQAIGAESQPGPIRSAQAALITALRQAGVSTRQLTAIGAQLAHLSTYSARIAADTARIAASNQESSTVRSAVLGSFNPLQAGVSQYTDRPGVSAASFLASETASANQAATFRAQLGKLKGHLSSGLYKQFAEAGPGQGAEQLAALAKATPTQLAAINKQYSSLYATAKGAGSDVSSYFYGSNLSAAKASITTTMKAAADELVAQIRHDLYGTPLPHHAATTHSSTAPQVNFHGPVNDPRAVTNAVNYALTRQRQLAGALG